MMRRKGLLTHSQKLLRLGILSAVSILIGCDAQRIEKLEEGVSSEAEVRRIFGDPENIWNGQANVRIFEYNRQPAGHRNYMITIASDGTMRAFRQVLTPENFAKVQPGMMMEEVRKMLGKPMNIIPYPLKNETYYNWRYLTDQNNTRMIFSAVMDGNLRVIRTETGLDPEAPTYGTAGR
jgi:hypothetical protein